LGSECVVAGRLGTGFTAAKDEGVLTHQKKGKFSNLPSIAIFLATSGVNSFPPSSYASIIHNSCTSIPTIPFLYCI